MKLFLPLLMLTVLFTHSTHAHNNFEHNLKKDVNQLIKQNEQLKQRMVRMETLLKELRRELRTGNGSARPTGKKSFSCLLTTKQGRDQSYFGKGPTRIEAKANAIAQCKKENYYSSACVSDRSEVECEAERL